MTEQLNFLGIETKEKPIIRSKYQKFKYENNYRKAKPGSKVRCEFCMNCYGHTYYDNKKTYYKCALLGYSSSTATDIRLSYVCDKWMP